MKRLLILTVLFFTAAHADTSDVYESIAGVSIGRVFLTPEERRLLDVERTHSPQTESRSTVSSSETVDPEPSTNASGYILNSSGKSRLWRDGDFVETAVTPTERFPGDVRIIRHSPPAAQEEPLEGAPADE